MTAERESILIVDDEESIRTILEEKLSHAHDCRTAESGDEALKILDRRPADLVLWEGYTFHGVERAGRHFPSPAGDVTKAYTSARHTFDREPRPDDADYAWPGEFLHLYFNLPAGSEPACPVSGDDGPCLVYDDRAPGKETLETTLHLRATWTVRTLTQSFALPVAYPITLSATQGEQP